MVFQSSERFFILIKLIGELVRVLEELLYGGLSAAVNEGFKFFSLLSWKSDAKTFMKKKLMELKDSSFKSDSEASFFICLVFDHRFVKGTSMKSFKFRHLLVKCLEEWRARENREETENDARI